MTINNLLNIKKLIKNILLDLSQKRCWTYNFVGTKLENYKVTISNSFHFEYRLLIQSKSKILCCTFYKIVYIGFSISLIDLVDIIAEFCEHGVISNI